VNDGSTLSEQTPSSSPTDVPQVCTYITHVIEAT
jgi:hypothetical protein